MANLDGKISTQEEALSQMEKFFEAYAVKNKSDEKINVVKDVPKEDKQIIVPVERERKEAKVEIEKEIEEKKEEEKEISTSKTNPDIDELKQKIDELHTIIAEQREQSLKQQHDQLEEQKQLAIKANNKELVKQIQDQQAKLPLLAPPEIKAFVEKHKEWWDGTSYEAIEMTDFAKRHDQLLENKKVPLKERLKLVDEALHRKFPDYFDKNDVKKTKVTSNNESAIVKNSKRSYTINDLSQEQQLMCRIFTKGKLLTEEQYINALIKDGQLK